jgi:hypothetical protein
MTKTNTNKDYFDQQLDEIEREIDEMRRERREARAKRLARDPLRWASPLELTADD